MSQSLCRNLDSSISTLNKSNDSGDEDCDDLEVDEKEKEDQRFYDRFAALSALYAQG